MKASHENVDDTGTDDLSPEPSLLGRAILAGQTGMELLTGLCGHSQRNGKESLVISNFLGLGSWWEPLLLFFLLV